jgi:hypothetical protein
MTVYDRHNQYILFPKSICPRVTVICFRSLARDMVVYDRHMTVYDGKEASFPIHSFCCDQYKTCYTGHFGFCTRYMTSCYWNMLAHPALPSFVPCGTRLARLNARLNAAHLLRPKRTLGQAKSNNKYSLVLVIDGCSDGSFAVEHELC